MGTTTRLMWAAAATVALSPAGAQEGNTEAPYEIGQRIRVTAPAHGREPIVGVVDSLRESAIVLDTAYREKRWFFDTGPILIDKYRYISIPFDDIRTLEISRGRSRAKGAFRGAVIGGIVGALTYGFGATPQLNPGWSDFRKGVGPGLAIGAPVGAVLGYLWGREKWRPVSGPYRPVRVLSPGSPR
jgi:hypothetical protein